MQRGPARRDTWDLGRSVMCRFIAFRGALNRDSEYDFRVEYRVEYSPECEGHLRALSARDRAIVLDSVDEQLTHEPINGEPQTSPSGDLDGLSQGTRVCARCECLAGRIAISTSRPRAFKK